MTRSRRAVRLSSLVPLYQNQLTDDIESRAKLLDTLVAGLRAERKRGLNKHWAYDRARHASLLRAYHDEVLSAGKLAAAILQTMSGERPAWADTIKSHEVRYTAPAADAGSMTRLMLADMAKTKMATA